MERFSLERKSGGKLPPRESSLGGLGSVDESESGVREENGAKEEDFGKSADAQLERFLFERDPNAPIDAPRERERIQERLEQIARLMREERSDEEPDPEREDAFAEIPSEKHAETASEALSPERHVLERARDILEKEAKTVDMADEYNDVLDSLSGLSGEDLARIKETGRDSEGRLLRSRKRGQALDPEIAKRLVGLAESGVRRLTWSIAGKLYEFVDALIKRLWQSLKGMAGFGEGSNRG